MTPPLTKDRLLLERQLIGRSINCFPSALTLADVLTETNFKDPLCKRIYPIIIEGVQSLELGLVPITRKYFKVYPDRDAHEITNLYDRAEPSPSFLELALCLLEEDMREKFLALITRNEQIAAKTSDFEAAAVWKQCAEHLASRSNDVFESINHLHAYLTACFPDGMDEYNSLRHAIPKMIDRIRERKNTRKFLDTLTFLAGVELSPVANKTINILKDWMILTMAGLKVPDKFHETIQQLNHTWND
jgi:hypothetical protein